MFDAEPTTLQELSNWTRYGADIVRTLSGRALAGKCAPEAAMLRLDHREDTSRGKNMAIESATGKPKAGRNIFCFEIRQLYESLLLSEPRGKQVQDIDQPNSDPRMQGRPPHYAGLAVMRSTSSAMMKNFADVRSR